MQQEVESGCEASRDMVMKIDDVVERTRNLEIIEMQDSAISRNILNEDLARTRLVVRRYRSAIGAVMSLHQIRFRSTERDSLEFNPESRPTQPIHSRSVAIVSDKRRLSIL